MARRAHRRSLAVGGRAGKSVQVTDNGKPLWILQPANGADADEAERWRAIDEILDEVLFTVQKIRGINDHGQFGQFGRLKMENTQLKPPSGAIAFTADMRHKHQQ